MTSSQSSPSQSSPSQPFSPQSFSLQPFDSDSQATDLSLTVSVSREASILSLAYVLKGDLTQVAIPPINRQRDRCDRLWEKTCFEFFLKEAGLKEAALQSSKTRSRDVPYWEFNFSPNGTWNVFSLSGYRQGLQEDPHFSETDFVTFPFEAEATPTQLSLTVSVNIGRLIAPGKVCCLGISAVVLLQTGQELFWAVEHPGSGADFHHPGSFVVELMP